MCAGKNLMELGLGQEQDEKHITLPAAVTLTREIVIPGCLVTGLFPESPVTLDTGITEFN